MNIMGRVISMADFFSSNPPVPPVVVDLSRLTESTVAFLAKPRRENPYAAKLLEPDLADAQAEAARRQEDQVRRRAAYDAPLWA